VAHGLTPRFFPRPGVFDLYNGETTVKGIQGEYYLIRKRQEVIIIIEDSRGHRIVLREGIVGKSFDWGTNPHTLIAILRKAVIKVRLHKSG
jgi:hypothetical protein